ncbi:transmembrane protein 174 [Boleophthalmus pectinirostris]|uniref:transmembrane protein 174 n=1 Tax=Boleophthalmus pectinirostris TaxID=150288 RepID=UPI0024318506|nr:transmembrane protein 174 [Boleophthalmus pectinirostris]
MDTNRAAVPAASTHQGNQFLISEKSSAALMFLGIFLGLVGIAFTTLGWQKYNLTTILDWTQLLDPILISVGGTFMLTSVLKLVMSCASQNEDITESARHSFTLNHQIVLHNGVTCIPASNNFRQPELGPSSTVLHDAPVTPSEPPPQYDTLYTDNRAPEGSQANVRSQKTLEEVHSEAETSPTCESPPAYEDIYPSTN